MSSERAENYPYEFVPQHGGGGRAFIVKARTQEIGVVVKDSGQRDWQGMAFYDGETYSVWSPTKRGAAALLYDLAVTLGVLGY
jgi:hypothetical protein